MSSLLKLLAVTALLTLPTTNFAAILEQTAPTPTAYVFGPASDFVVMSGSATGDITLSVSGVDIQLGIGNTSTSGCEAADFAGFPAGNIALIQRGACFFRDKVANAQAAGALGVLLFNQGNTADPNRTDARFGTLDPFVASIPVLSLSYALGETFAGTAGLTVRMQVTEEDLRALQAVPLPATLSLLLVGLAAFTVSRRKRS